MRKRWLLEKWYGQNNCVRFIPLASFGKDSTGRSDSNFNIKTLDSDGKPILHLEHSVTGVLSVDGKTVTLQRCYVENWVKPRGTTEESLKNHATEFYLNGVKLATKRSMIVK